MALSYSSAVSRLMSCAQAAVTVGQSFDAAIGNSVAIVTALVEQPFRVLVLGEFSRGKSTFINALVGARLLPSSLRPTTAVICSLTNGTKRQARVVYRDERPDDTIALPLERPDKALKPFTADVKRAQTIAHIDIVYPVRHLGMRMALIDTPGVNDIDAQREEITFGYLSRADAAIILLDPQQPLSGSERRFLEEKVLENDIRKLLFVLNKAGDVSANDLSKAITYVREQLVTMGVFGTPQVLAVDSKAALKAARRSDPVAFSASGFPVLEERLRSFLEEASGRGRILRASFRVGRSLSSLSSALRELVACLDGERVKLRSRLAAHEQRCRAKEAERTQLQSRVQQSLLEFEAAAERSLNDGLAGIRAQAHAVFSRSTFPSDDDSAELRSIVNRASRDLVVQVTKHANAVVSPYITQVIAEPPPTQGELIVPAALQGGALQHAKEELIGGVLPAELLPAVLIAAPVVVGVAVLFSTVGAVAAAVFGGGWFVARKAKRREEMISDTWAALGKLQANVRQAGQGTSIELRRVIEEEVFTVVDQELQLLHSQHRELSGAIGRDLQFRQSRKKELELLLLRVGQIKRDLADIRERV